MIIKDVKDPALTHNLSEFLMAGRMEHVTKYGDASFLERDKNILYVVKNVIEDYIPDLKEMALKVVLTDDEYLKYQYNPKRLAYDVYGATELYYIILMLNNIGSIIDFNTKTLLMMKRLELFNSLASIMLTEGKDIKRYNQMHT
jgi:hypothetical protein